MSSHQLLFQPFSQTIELDKGGEILITDLKSKLFLDGSLISDQQIQSITAKLPSRLKLDESTARISGTAPSDVLSQDLTISAKDQYGESTQFNIHLAFRSDVFANEVGQLNATIGDHFSYVIPSQVFVQKVEKLTIDFASLSKYLRFDPSTFTFSGTVHSDFSPQRIKCVLTAVSSDGTIRDTQASRFWSRQPQQSRHPEWTVPRSISKVPTARLSASSSDLSLAL